MAMLDYGLLLKILGMTQSSNDGEALNAMRKANDMLKKASLQWSQVIAIVQSSANGSTFDASTFREEILRQATMAQAERNRQFGEELRAKQAARDKVYTQFNDPDFGSDHGWTTKGPYDHGPYTRQDPKPEPEVDEVQAELKIEAAAREMTEHIEGEALQTNWFVFAMTEPDVAQWLFRLREGHAFHRILFKQVCEHGELSGSQLDVVERMMKRDQHK